MLRRFVQTVQGKAEEERSVGWRRLVQGRDKRATLEDEDDGDLGSEMSTIVTEVIARRLTDEDDDVLEWENNANEEDEEMNPKKKKHKNKNNLIVEFDPSKVKQNAKATADRWFSNDLFSEIGKSTSTEPEKSRRRRGRSKKRKKRRRMIKQKTAMMKTKMITKVYENTRERGNWRRRKKRRKLPRKVN